MNCLECSITHYMNLICVGFHKIKENHWLLLLLQIIFFYLPFILFHYDRHVGTIIACMFRTKLNPGGYFIFDIIKNSVFSKCEDIVIMC